MTYIEKVLKMLFESKLDRYLLGLTPYEYKSHYPDEYYLRVSQVSTVYNESLLSKNLYHEKIEQFIDTLLREQDDLAIRTAFEIIRQCQSNKFESLLSNIFTTEEYRNYSREALIAFLLCVTEKQNEILADRVIEIVINHELLEDYLFFGGNIRLVESNRVGPGISTGKLSPQIDSFDLWRFEKVSEYYQKHEDFFDIDNQIDRIDLTNPTYAERVKTLITAYIQIGTGNKHFIQKLDYLLNKNSHT